jgi:hypothetical protein
MCSDSLPSIEERPTTATWTACIAAALLMLGLSTYFVHILNAERRLYRVMEMKELPDATNRTLELGPYLWVFALAAAGWGFRLLRARQRSSALTWFLWSLLLLVIVQGLMTYALLRPIIIIQQNLAK